MTRPFQWGRLLLAGGALCGLAPLGCSSTGDQGAQPGQRRDCGGEQRVLLDCSSEVSYQGARGEGSVAVMNIASASGQFEERAIRRVNAQVEQYLAAQTRACRDYNACVLSAEQYRTEATATRQRLTSVPALVEALKAAKTEAERLRALDALYRGVVPDAQRTEEISFRMGVVAQLPGSSAPVQLAPGASVPTGAKLHFTVSASRDAHLYMFQVTPGGEVSVLFPDPRIGTRNPLRGGQRARVPATQWFRVTAQDVGTEKVYVVVSRKPLADLDGALNKVKRGEVTAVTQDPWLSQVAAVQHNARPGGCNSRGLALTGPADAGGCRQARQIVLDDADTDVGDPGHGAGLGVRTRPGDGIIVTVFPFEHVRSRKRPKNRGIPLED